MTRLKALLIAAPVAAGLLAAPAAHAEWHGRDGWHGGGGGWHRGGYGGGYGGGWHRGGDGGAAAAIIGLGAAAIIGGAIASQAYAPPPAYYPAPGYYYAPPPGDYTGGN